MQAAARPALAVIIVSYNSGCDVCTGLTALEKELRPFPGARVIVVDNASPDNSADIIDRFISANAWDGWASVVRGTKNGGFSAGNNIAIRTLLDSASAPRYFYFLNPDAVVFPDAVSELIAFLENNPEAGIAGSQLERPDGTIKRRSPYTFPSPLHETRDYWRRASPLAPLRTRLKIPAAPRPTRDDRAAAKMDWVTGASCAVRSELFRDIGLFDENYFLYFEDIDFCRRARERGWEIWLVPSSRVRHSGGASTGCTFESAPRPAAWHASREVYFRKHFGKSGYYIANCMRAIGAITAAPFTRLHA